MKKLLMLASSFLIVSSAVTIYAEETTVEETTVSSEMNEKDPFDTSSYKTVFETDMYKIGADMPAGEYKIFAQDEYSSFSLTGDARGEDYIASDMITTFAFVSVEDGQFLELRDCFAVPVEETWPVQPEDDKLTDGVYRVGIDLEPGEYKVSVTEGADYSSYKITEDANAKEYIDSNFISKSNYIEVKDGEYLTLRGAELPLK